MMTSETIQSAIEAWLTTIGAEGVSRATIVTYKGHMQVFLKGLRGDELTAFTLRRFFQEYRQGRSPHSVRSVYTTVHAFLRFAVAEGMADETLLTAMKRPKVPQSEKAVYQQGQMAALFHALAANRSPLGLRDYALCSLLLDCGLRTSEACRLSVSDLSEGMALVRQTKTGRIRSVPLGQKAQRAIYGYLATGRPRLKPKCENLLVSRDGLPLSRNTVRLVLDRLSEKLGFRLSAHRFRHSFTTMMLRRGCDLETLRQMGGWSSYTMLMTYTHLAADDLKQAHATRSPLDNL
jgi:site-specific recombinase XerD